MSWWRDRDPGSFSTPFHHALTQAGVGEIVIQTYYTKGGADAAQKQWRLFMYNVRLRPHHLLHHACVHYTHRTKVRWNKAIERWELLLISREKVMNSIQIL